MRPRSGRQMAIGYPIVSIAIGLPLAYVIATFAADLLAQGGFPLPPEGRRIGCIDGLRGYLALSVFAHHFIKWIQVTRLGEDWALVTISVRFFHQLGAAGVALFFMTTGLVFYPRVLAGFRACSWPAIYTSRIFRIVPLIVFSVAVITFIIYLRTGNGLDDKYPIAAAQWIITWGEPPLLGYENSYRLNAGVLWSLWFEWLFYILVLPALALIMDVTRVYFSSYVLPIGLLLISVVFRTFTPTSIFLYLPLFATGMCAYEVRRNEKIVQLLRTPAATTIAVAALGFGMVVVSNPYYIALPLFGFFFVCVACGNSIWGLLRTRGALVLGESSYSIYLLHGILLSLFFIDAARITRAVSTQQLPLLLPFLALVLIGFAALTFLFIERPAIRLGARIVRYWKVRRFQPGASGIAPMSNSAPQ
jgi:peptidoglycan/LPS O-acetylase OafA/YrhL